MKQTSRHWMVDWIQLIGSCVAQCSHLQEVLNSYTQNPDITKEDAEFCSEQISRYTKVRRDVMEKIRQSFDGNMHYWCSLKHAIESRQYATEVLYAEPENMDLMKIQQECSNWMYAILSKFIWQEITTCWRCFHDAIQLHEELKNWTVLES